MRAHPFWRLLPGAALILLASAQSHALTLGRVQGAAVIGRPLDVSVPVGLGAGTAPADFCPQVRVLYGDGQVDARTLDIVSGPGPDMATLRVRVAAPINEPFVTVYLDVGCTSRLTRQYVLLADHPGELRQPAPLAAAILPQSDSRAVVTSPALLPQVESQPIAPLPPPLDAPSAAPGVAAGAPTEPLAPAVAPSPQPATQPASQPASQPAPAAVARAAAPVPAPAAASQRRVARAPVAASRPPAPAPRVERPRLRLDAPQVALDTKAPPTAGRAAPGPAISAAPPAPVLSQAVASSATSLQPAQPAAPPPDDRLSTLETEMRAMRTAMVASNLAVAEMRMRLEQAERERFANPLVYALVALFAASLALAGLFWHRSRKAQKAWWLAQSPPNRRDGDAPGPSAGGRAERASTGSPPLPAPASEPVAPTSARGLAPAAGSAVAAGSVIAAATVQEPVEPTFETPAVRFASDEPVFVQQDVQPEGMVPAIAFGDAAAVASVAGDAAPAMAGEAPQEEIAAILGAGASEDSSLDINLDDLLQIDLPAATLEGATELESAAQQTNLLDFDFDLGQDSKPRGPG